MPENINDGDVYNSFKFSEELISDGRTEDGSKITEHGKCMVDNSGLVFMEVEFLFQVDR